MTGGLFHWHSAYQRGYSNNMSPDTDETHNNYTKPHKLLICFPLADLYCVCTDSSGLFWTQHWMKYVSQIHMTFYRSITLPFTLTDIPGNQLWCFSETFRNNFGQALILMIACPATWKPIPRCDKWSENINKITHWKLLSIPVETCLVLK